MKSRGNSLQREGNRYPGVAGWLGVAALWLMASACGSPDSGSTGDRQATGAGACADSTLSWIDPAEVEGIPGTDLQGEFEGRALLPGSADSMDVGLQLALYGPERVRGSFYKGGLPGAEDHELDPPERLDVEGVRIAERLELAPEEGYSLLYLESHVTVLDEEKNYLGHLDRVYRESATLGLDPGEEATALFQGDESDLENWQEGATMSESELHSGAMTRREFGDMRLHVEVWPSWMPCASDQRRTNSGLYIQDRYEVQIMDSFGLEPMLNGSGSLYREVMPALNMSLPPLRWQTYDVWFRAPRFNEEGEKVEPVRVSVWYNGVRVIDDEVLEGGTGRGGQLEEVPRAPLLLQEHPGSVRFRNIWIEEDPGPAPERFLLDGPLQRVTSHPE
ncbi:MAG: 3-keto-disaccharide hydrolase [Bacteroidota bacterium]